MKTRYTFLVTSLAAKHATATWDLFASPFLMTPQYNNNECSDKQQSGFDWSDLNDGDKDFKYGDFDFSGGWSCSNAHGKRDSLSRRTFGSKTIKNTVTKDKPASFSCDQRPSGFSVTEFDVSVEFDTDLELHYKMSDGSTCKQYSSCAQGGSTLENTQCGGARSVDIYLGKHYNGDRSSCEIGFHHIGFDCNKGTIYTPPKAPEAPPASSVTPTNSPTPPSHSTGRACQGQDCAAESISKVSSIPPVTESPVGIPSAVITSSAAPYTNSSASTGAMPPYIATSPPIIESSTSSVAVPSSAASATGCSNSGSCEGSAVFASTTFSSSSSTIIPQPPSPNFPAVSPPEVLPKCINTWLQLDSKCKDNTDKTCYCTNPSFTKNVIDCVAAWCGTDAETQQSLQYLVGICAAHLSENPKIISDCPSYLPLNPDPSSLAAPTGSLSSRSVSDTLTLSITTSLSTVSAAPAPPPVTTLSYGTTSITVPLVHFTTAFNTGGSNGLGNGSSGAAPTAAPIALVPGPAPVPVPAQTPATTTAGDALLSPVPSTLGTKTAPLATGTGGLRPSSPAQFTGAAVLGQRGAAGSVVFGAFVALVAL